METVTDFLLARIAEDEERASDFHAVSGPACDLTAGDWMTTGVCDCGHPARVLAECVSKRWIMNLHAPWEDSGDCSMCGDVPQVSYPCSTLRALALPYADHPDYPQEWRP